MRARRLARKMKPATRDRLWALLSIGIAMAAMMAGLSVPPMWGLVIGAAACTVIVVIARR